MNRSDARSRDWAATAALAAAAAYGWVHAANEGFYGSYGVTVSEVGLDYQPLLARTLVVGGAFAVVAVAFASLLGACLVAAVATMRGTTRVLDWAIDDNGLGGGELAVGILAAIVLAAGGTTLALRDDPHLGLVVAILAVATLPATLPKRIAHRARNIAARRGVRAAAVATFVVVYIAGLFALLAAGSGWARDARRDRKPTLAAMVLIGRWPTPVTVVEPGGLTETGALLLGSNDGATIVYDRASGSLLRLPTDTITTRTDTQGSPGE